MTVPESQTKLGAREICLLISYLPPIDYPCQVMDAALSFGWICTINWCGVQTSAAWTGWTWDSCWILFLFIYIASWDLDLSMFASNSEYNSCHEAVCKIILHHWCWWRVGGILQWTVGQELQGSHMEFLIYIIDSSRIYSLSTHAR